MDGICISSEICGTEVVATEIEWAWLQSERSPDSFQIDLLIISIYPHLSSFFALQTSLGMFQKAIADAQPSSKNHTWTSDMESFRR
jgi:hypothetical protein